MEHYDVRRLALLLALQAEVEGMKANNKIHELNGAMPLHNEGEFQQMAEQMRNLAFAHNEQL